MYPVTSSFGAPTFFSLERAAAPYFGIKVCFCLLVSPWPFEKYISLVFASVDVNAIVLCDSLATNCKFYSVYIT